MLLNYSEGGNELYNRKEEKDGPAISVPIGTIYQY